MYCQLKYIVVVCFHDTFKLDTGFTSTGKGIQIISIFLFSEAGSHCLILVLYPIRIVVQPRDRCLFFRRSEIRILCAYSLKSRFMKLNIFRRCRFPVTNHLSSLLLFFLEKGYGSSGQCKLLFYF